MTVLSACQEAATELSEKPPSSLFTGTISPFVRELRLFANRAAVAIAEAHDWQALTLLGTLTGDGSATSFTLPDGYDRMPKKARVHSANFNTAFRPARDLDQWLYLNDSNLNGTPGNWIILGGEFQIYPAMPVGQTARFYYLTNRVVRPASGDDKTAFTADTDTFVLSERLLALGIAWRWRASKRVDYSIELENYNLALAEEIGRDRGPRILTVGRQRIPAELAYDGVLGGPGGRTFDSTDEPTFDEE